MAKQEYADLVERTIRVGKFHATESSETRVYIDQMKDGKSLVNVRQWYRKKDDPTWMPGKGTVVNADDLLEFEALIKKAVRKARKAGLLEESQDAD